MTINSYVPKKVSDCLLLAVEVVVVGVGVVEGGEAAGAAGEVLEAARVPWTALICALNLKIDLLQCLLTYTVAKDHLE